jgi:uncharacterized protein
MKMWNSAETQKGNKYFHDRKMKRFHLCHPLFYYILRLSQRMEIEELKQWVQGLGPPSGWVEIEDYGHFPVQEIHYYFQKFFLLKENGYFGEIEPGERLNFDINGETVLGNIANTKHVVLEATERCNLACAYCTYGNFYYNEAKRENKDLDTRRATRLLNYLVELWNSPLNKSHQRNVYISFYGGEPLLNIEFIREMVDVVKRLKALHNRFTFSMTTNGLLLRKYMDFLYKNDFHLQISLDGNEKNNGYRVFENGAPAYPAIQENVNALRKKYPDYFSRRVNFISVLHNKNSVSDVYRYFNAQFGKVPFIRGLKTFGVREDQKKEFWATYVNIDQSLHESEDYSVIEKEMFFMLPNIDDARRWLHYSCDCRFDNYNNLIYPVDGEKRTATGTCRPFSLRMYLTVNGKLLPCERVSPQFGLGDVTPDRVVLDCDQIATVYNTYFHMMKKQCQGCFNADSCSQCIFSIGGLEAGKPVCNGFMNEKDKERYLSMHLGYLEDTPGAYRKMLRGDGHE